MTPSEAKRIWLKHAEEYKNQGQSEEEIAVSMGCSSITDYRATRARYKRDLHDEEFAGIIETLRTGTADTSFLDVGFGASRRLGISQDRLRAALAVLKEEGFEVHIVQVQQKDMPPELGMKTTLKVLAPPGTKWSDVNAQKHLISQIDPRNEEE